MRQKEQLRDKTEVSLNYHPNDEPHLSKPRLVHWIRNMTGTSLKEHLKGCSSQVSPVVYYSASDREVFKLLQSRHHDENRKRLYTNLFYSM